jgi:hypothetical protein
MSSNDKILHAAFAGLLAIGLRKSAGAQDDRADKEKCYGVAKAGQNDCGTRSTRAPARRRRTTPPTSGSTSPRARARKLGGKTKAPTGK